MVCGEDALQTVFGPRQRESYAETDARRIQSHAFGSNENLTTRPNYNPLQTAPSILSLQIMRVQKNLTEEVSREAERSAAWKF